MDQHWLLSCGLLSYSLFDIVRQAMNVLYVVVDCFLIRSLTFWECQHPTNRMLWIAFLFALWHFIWKTGDQHLSCGLLSYSLFDISHVWRVYNNSVVDCFLIRSLTFLAELMKQRKWLWIAFLFALWHWIPTERIRRPSCGLLSYSLFDIQSWWP